MLSTLTPIILLVLNQDFNVDIVQMVMYYQVQFMEKIKTNP